MFEPRRIKINLTLKEMKKVTRIPDVKNREKILTMQSRKADKTKLKPMHQGKLCLLFIFVALITCVLFYIYFYDKARIYIIDKSLITRKGVGNTLFNDTFNHKNVHNKVLSQSDFKLKLKENIISGKVEPLLTLFTTWNNNNASEKDVVHNNTVKNWLSFRPFVIPVVFTNNTSIASECRRNGWDVLPARVTALDDIPVIKFMYLDAMKIYNTSYYAYSNSDILYSSNLIDTLLGCAYNLSYILNGTYSNDSFLYGKSVYAQQTTLIIGQRTNVQNVTKTEGSTWAAISSVAKNRGKLFIVDAIDYFITTRNYPWKNSAEVIVQKRSYGNWILYNARKHKHITIDSTKTILALHQTTSAGNLEHEKHGHVDYNRILLRKFYSGKFFHTEYGCTWCAKYNTQYSQDHVVVTNRAIRKQCGVLE